MMFQSDKSKSFALQYSEDFKFTTPPTVHISTVYDFIRVSSFYFIYSYKIWKGCLLLLEKTELLFKAGGIWN